MSTEVRRTSAEAYRRLVDEGLLPQRRREVYAALYTHGPATGTELWRAMGESGAVVHGNIRARLGELRALGLACEVQERTCRVTDRVTIEWDVTLRTEPLPLPRKPTRAQQIDDMVTFIEDVADWLETATNLPKEKREKAAARMRERLVEITNPKEKEKPLQSTQKHNGATT